MGTNELGEKTVKCIAKRDRLFYFQRMLSIGDPFECDERTAKNWEKTGVVTIVHERPSLKDPVVHVDPVIATVVAESGEVKPPHEARMESGEATAAAEAAAAAATTPEAKPEEVKAPVAAEAKPEVKQEAPKASKYERRDLRAKP